MSKASQGGAKVRSNSAYGQKKNIENQKKQEEAYAAMMEESRRNEEKHKALMRENLLRRKAKEQELSKAVEAKKASDTEALNQRKNQIKEAYQKFLKNQDEPASKSKPTSAKATGDSTRRNQAAEERATRVTDHIFDQIEKYNHFEQPDTAGLLDALDISSSMYNLDKILAKNESKMGDITRKESSHLEIPEPMTDKENEKSQSKPNKVQNESKTPKNAAQPAHIPSKTPPPRQQDPKSAGLKDNSKPINVQNTKKASSAKKIEASPTEHIEEDIKMGYEDEEEDNPSIISKKSEPKLVRIENLTKAEQLKNWEYQFLDSKAQGKKKVQSKDLANEFEDIVNQGDGVFGWAKDTEIKPTKSEITKEPTKPAPKKSVEPGVYYPAQQQQPQRPVQQPKPEKLNMQPSKAPPLQEDRLPPINKASSAYKEQQSFLPPLPEHGGRKQVVIETNIKATQNVQKRTSQTPNASSNAGQGQGQKVIAPKAQQVGAADIRRQQNRRNNSRGKPVKSTVSTRDEDINVDEFLKYDLINVNKQEAELQAELFRLHKQTAKQVKEIEEKYDICTQYKRTNDLINRQITYAGQNVADEPEEDIEQSLVKLEELLSKQRNRMQSAPSGDIAGYPMNHKDGLDLDVFTFKNEIPRSQTSNQINQQYPVQGKPPQPKPSNGKAVAIPPPKQPAGPPPPQNKLARHGSREEYKRYEPPEDNSPVFEEEPEIEEDVDVKSNSSEEVEQILRGRAPAKNQQMQNEFDDDENSALGRKPAGKSKTRSEVSHKPEPTESTTPRNEAKPANGNKGNGNSYAGLKDKKEKIKEEAANADKKKEVKAPADGEQDGADGQIKLNTKIDVHKLLFD